MCASRQRRLSLVRRPDQVWPSTMVYNLFIRWSHRGFWLKLLYVLVNGCGDEEHRDRQHLRNAFCRLKVVRRVATRYHKLAAKFLSGVALTTALAF